MQNTPYDSRRLARFIAASGLTNLADGIAVLAWAWVASLITRDALWIALVPIALRSPWFLFAIPAGIVTDRAERRRLILAADTVRVVAFALVTLVLWQALPLPPAAPRGLAQPGLFAALLIGWYVAASFAVNATATALALWLLSGVAGQFRARPAGKHHAMVAGADRAILPWPCARAGRGNVDAGAGGFGVLGAGVEHRLGFLPPARGA
jgi:hypothetical protein